MESKASTVGPNLPTEHEPALDGPEYHVLYSPELRAKYITLTDELIRRMAEQQTDVAVFLDKSARPVAWLVNELWDTLAPQDPETGSTMPKPYIKFLNIDREQWGPFIGRSEDKTGGINVGRIPAENIGELRQVMTRIPGVSPIGEETLLTNKKVMVVDEVRSSGDTLHMAEGIMKRAFPDAAEIDGVYWMLKPAERDERSGALISGEVPVWYSDRSVEGRLIANRDATKSRAAGTSVQLVGALWLSTRFRGHPDEKGRQLKREVKQLAKDLREHELPYIPSPEYSFEIVEGRVSRLNGLSVEEYVKLRSAATHNGTLDIGDFVNLYKEYSRVRSANL
jgi:hypothetical protein